MTNENREPVDGTAKRLRIAAVADLHYGRGTPTSEPLFAQMPDADVLLLCGDLADHGSADEARRLAAEISASVRIPVIAVLGNHDFQQGQEKEVTGILTDAGVRVLDGDGYDIDGVGFAGVKGFGGGFGEHSLGLWGESAIKSFVHEAIDETLKLERALASLQSPVRIVLLHYSPIQATVEGEAQEIFPFLGSSRLEEPLNRYSVSAVFHGHAHHGRPEGRTASNVPVFNVALPVLQRSKHPRPFRLIEIEIPTAVTASATHGIRAA